MTWIPSKSPRECSGINRRNTVSCFVIHKYGNGKQRLLVPADPCASSQITQSQRVHTKERRTEIVIDAETGRKQRILVALAKLGQITQRRPELFRLDIEIIDDVEEVKQHAIDDRLDPRIGLFDLRAGNAVNQLLDLFFLHDFSPLV